MSMAFPKVGMAILVSFVAAAAAESLVRRVGGTGSARNAAHVALGADAADAAKPERRRVNQDIHVR
eukprot:CAMPEP_0176057776 /NCGR_PEP_ID=MMETSP0120_2-20121206/28777_2 /TAXON_ID=160619 /ORGANISM="Kryptoperidinium foliaceum, Strain CCMP 1326" /LENGTH=65 /DNA_ID=CAMNT_0017391287 /DNA_START=43 /DNA_END=237 /DNA_ORIENTATION=-